jgi:hypothetical protein
MKKFYEYSEISSAFEEFADKENGHIPDQSHPRYIGLGRCWGWRGPLNNCGYPTIPVVGRSLLAHRISFSNHNGGIPYKACVLHQCDNRSCTNPEHLHIGTHADNMREASEKRNRTGKTITNSKNEYMRKYMQKYRKKKKAAANS